MTTPNRPPLSPAAQVVVDAFENASDGEYVEGVWVVNERTMLAAALRAAAASKPWAGHAYGKTLWHVGWDADRVTEYQRPNNMAYGRIAAFEKPFALSSEFRLP